MKIEVPKQQAIDLINRRGWAKGEWGTDSEMAPVCLHGAIRLCCPVKGDAYIIEQVWQKRGRGIAWNDAEDTKKDDVLRELGTAGDITDAELAETFGPQWEQIVALVRRASILTEDEVDRLTAAWDAAMGAAWDAVRDVATDAAMDVAEDAVRDVATDAATDAAWDAAMDVAEDAAMGAAWVAVKGAARALSVRDLIGQHGFTQEHYDTLTRPWRTLIGKLHPDDAEPRKAGA